MGHNMDYDNFLHNRTDLALERREEVPVGENSGVIISEEYNNEIGVKLTRLEIINETGAKKLGRAVGVYYTFETMPMDENDGGFHEELSEYVAGYIRELVERVVDKEPPYRVLVAGLGNREATPDALGPYVVNNLYISQSNDDVELNKEKKVGMDRRGKMFAYVSSIIPGVLAQTGLETAKIIRGVIDSTNPDVLLAIDALAARSTERLANTIQICDTGIMPGSGVGNHRNAIDKESMGVPVIAIGVPTVVDAATIVGDAVDRLLESIHDNQCLGSIERAINSFEPAQKMQFMRELISENMAGMYVTPKDIDELVKRISYTISEAINICMATPGKSDMHLLAYPRI